MTVKTAGHAAAIVTIFIWGLTFISTKILLTGFLPVEILFYRFLIGYLALLAACPHFLGKTSIKYELYFAAAGLTGICLYYLLENIALTYTLASNVGVILATAPFFTAIAGFIFMHSDEHPRKRFFIGFVIAMAGIYLISTAESGMAFNLTGDLLALGAAVVWALYSVLTRKISTFGCNTILITRRIFFSGCCLCCRRCIFLVLLWEQSVLHSRSICLTFSFWGWGHLHYALLPGILPLKCWAL